MNAVGVVEKTGITTPKDSCVPNKPRQSTCFIDRAAL